MKPPKKTVSVIMTVKNDPAGCAVSLDSLATQTRTPSEIVVVDGGSADDSIDVVRRKMARMPNLRLIKAPGANIARGRNIGVKAATGEIIATTDAGCIAQPDWLEKLTGPFEEAGEVEISAGFYRIDPHTLLEEVVGLATMRGQLEPADPRTFNPSARSFACSRSLWERAGGWPEWIGFSEDTLFDHKVRKMGASWRFVQDAVVYWRPRGSLRSVARQFYNYGTGRGHTQIGAADFAYNLRNLLIVLAAAGLCLVTPWAIPGLISLGGYFYVWTFHHQAVRIARHTGRSRAYPLCLCVMCVVLLANLAGYLVGSWQRRRDRERYRGRMEAYMVCSAETANSE